jgi:hypothetical protein
MMSTVNYGNVEIEKVKLTMLSKKFLKQITSFSAAFMLHFGGATIFSSVLLNELQTVWKPKYW